jgi:hypothetical protein
MWKKHLAIFAVAALSFGIHERASAAVVFDWTTEPERADFHNKHSASTTVDGLTMSATMLSSSSYIFWDKADSPFQTVGLGARGIGGSTFDGEPGFTFSFNHQGVLTAVSLAQTFGHAFTLHTPNNGSVSYNTGSAPGGFSGVSYTFSAGEQFTWQHGGGAYEIGTMSVTLTPEPATLVSWALIVTGAAIFVRRQKILAAN